MISIVQEAFNPWDVMQAYQQQMAVRVRRKLGATSVFVGSMRDFNQDDQVDRMVLEYYPGMTEKQLGMIAAQANEQWSLIDSLIMHRVGEVFPTDVLVLVAVWAEHRADTFEACRFLMEALKAQAPFWKKECVTGQQARWVAENTEGYKRH